MAPSEATAQKWIVEIRRAPMIRNGLPMPFCVEEYAYDFYACGGPRFSGERTPFVAFAASIAGVLLPPVFPVSMSLHIQNWRTGPQEITPWGDALASAASDL